MTTFSLAAAWTTLGNVLAITVPIYLCVAVGYCAVKRAWFAAVDMRVLGQFVLRLALPALLFNAIAQRPLAQTLHMQYFVLYAVGGLATIAVAWFYTRRVWTAAPPQAAVYAMGCSCPNSGFVGYPVVALALGAPVAGVALGLNMLVENLILIPLLLALMQPAVSDGGQRKISRWAQIARTTAQGLVRNPLVIGLLLGVAASLAQSSLSLTLPTPAQRVVGLFAQASSALSLFAIGGTLAGVSATQWQDLKRAVLQVSAGKLLLHPALMLAALWLLEHALTQLGMAPLSREMRAALLITAACPVFGIYPLLAQAVGLAGLAAAVQAASTLAAFVTLSVLLFWLV